PGRLRVRRRPVAAERLGVPRRAARPLAAGTRARGASCRRRRARRPRRARGRRARAGARPPARPGRRSRAAGACSGADGRDLRRARPRRPACDALPSTSRDRPLLARVRLNAWLARAGVASRRGADELIKAERVRVNGEPGQLNTFVGARDRVEVDGSPVTLQPLAYVLLNKPAGVVTTARDPHGP